jgi:DNA repair protein RadD
VDVVAILRPTESNSLYQQIVGRGLRLDPGKKDCIILDYTGMGHDLYRPEVSERRPHRDATLVEVPCPVCSHVNHFWGELDHDGHVVEHSGQKCQGAKHDPLTLKVIPCGHRFRFKLCATCGEENDLQAQNCESCHIAFTSAAEKIKQAKLSKNTHVLTPVEITFNERLDKNGRPYLEVRYYDADGQYLSEAHFFNHQVALKKFNINFLRSHLRRPELAVRIQGPQDVIQMKSFLRLPAFVIARKQEKFWKITEKVFAEELRS